MNTFLKPAVLGLLTGVVGVGGLSSAFAACQTGCQESYAWAIDTNIGGLFQYKRCHFYEDEQAHEGAVAGDFGEVKALNKMVNYTSCPFGDCGQNCPALADEYHQSGGGANQGCLPGQFSVPHYECDMP